MNETLNLYANPDNWEHVGVPTSKTWRWTGALGPPWIPAQTALEEMTANITRMDVAAIERLSDAAIRAGSYETAVEGYALALRLRSETGFHPLRRADDDRPVT